MNAPDATTIFLIRHGESDGCHDRLAGRLPAVPLTPAGRAQAARVAQRLRDHVSTVAALYTSPLLRAIDTAVPVARAFGVALTVLDDVVEVDFGSWTGRSFHDLDRDPCWRLYNERRSSASVPGGENPAALRARVRGAVAHLIERHPRESIAVVSHAEVIRTVMLEALGQPLDSYSSIEVDLASISAVRWEGRGWRVLFVNDHEQPTSEYAET